MWYVIIKGMVGYWEDIDYDWFLVFLVSYLLSFSVIELVNLFIEIFCIWII